jgi:hypothetical protein
MRTTSQMSHPAWRSWLWWLVRRFLFDRYKMLFTIFRSHPHPLHSGGNRHLCRRSGFRTRFYFDRGIVVVRRYKFFSNIRVQKIIEFRWIKIHSNLCGKKRLRFVVQLTRARQKVFSAEATCSTQQSKRDTDQFNRIGKLFFIFPIAPEHHFYSRVVLHDFFYDFACMISKSFSPFGA